jgi:hypothetical protein
LNETSFISLLGWRRGLTMTRISATAAILIGLVLMTSHPVAAQSDQDAQCFPWQEYRNGRCVAKPSQAPPPMPEPSPSPAAIGTCDGGTRSLSGQCVCPVNTHLDMSGHCVADAAPPPLPPIVSPPPTRKADDNIVCDGGKVAGGQCLCPNGFMMVTTTTNANGGMCVKTNAANCQGGELTVGGTCLCNGQVIMSGETYLLEYTNGKCVPKRCPVQTQWRDGNRSRRASLRRRKRRRRKPPMMKKTIVRIVGAAWCVPRAAASPHGTSCPRSARRRSRRPHPDLPELRPTSIRRTSASIIGPIKIRAIR